MPEHTTRTCTPNQSECKGEEEMETKQKGAPTPQKDILYPSPNDVLMGRGAPSTDFAGNLKFRELVKERRQEYVNTKRRKDKQGIAGEIIDKVKRRGGRFLEKVEVQRLSQKSGTMQNVTVWHEVDHRKTLLVKVKQLMRDGGPVAQQKRITRRELRRHKERQTGVHGNAKEDSNMDLQDSLTSTGSNTVGTSSQGQAMTGILRPASAVFQTQLDSLRTALAREQAPLCSLLEQQTAWNIQKELQLRQNLLIQRELWQIDSIRSLPLPRRVGFPLRQMPPYVGQGTGQSLHGSVYWGLKAGSRG